MKIERHTTTYIKIPILFAFLVYVSVAVGQESDYVKIGQASVSSFRCSTLSAHARYSDEEARLLTYGLEKARIFIKAARDKKVSINEFNRSEFVLPIVMRAWSFNPLNVPIDFSAGQIYESIWEATTTELREKTEKMTTHQETYEVWARAEYKAQNCELVGK